MSSDLNRPDIDSWAVRHRYIAAKQTNQDCVSITVVSALQHLIANSPVLLQTMETDFERPEYGTVSPGTT